MRGTILMWSGDKGVVSAEGQRYDFGINEWKGNTAPAANLTVDAVVTNGRLSSVTPVNEADLAKEKMAALTGQGSKVAKAVNRAIRSNGERSETENAAQQWHTDQTFLKVPARASMLRCELAPQCGGDTMWANMYAVYDDLSDGLKATLEPLQAFHSLFGTRSKVMAGRKQLSAEELARVEGAMQPVVLKHPDTGRRALYINEQCVDHFDGWTIEESKPLLEYLYNLNWMPKYTYRHRWQPGDIVFWDNRCTQHYAVMDYAPCHRKMERAGIIG